MTNKLALAGFTVIAIACGISAQSVYTPDKGSSERKAILDALRVPVERELKQKIVFVADKFNVQGNWAFVGGIPRSSDGGEPNYRNTVYFEAKNEGAFDNNFFGLVRKTGGKWKVVKFAIGCTDVCYAEWWKETKAPKAIFDITY
ncbi:MAG: hypothetical protein HOP17_09480 [Acidobacteria bacterium]|nr:hypothetical protein [Acidobacteriota bacterium]